MTISQKRAIGYAIRRKEKENMQYFLIWKGLMQEFELSSYKTMTWFIKSKHLMGEYNYTCICYDNNLKNLPRI